MAWGKFDDAYPRHRKVWPLSDAAFRLDVSAILWCCEALTDGRIAPDDLAGICPIKQPRKAAGELVRRGRWHEPGHDCPRCPQTDNGWVVHDYLDYRPSRDKAAVTREARAKAGAQGGQASGRSRRGEPPEVEANPKQFASGLPTKRASKPGSKPGSKPPSNGVANDEATANPVVPKPQGSYVSNYLASVDADARATDTHSEHSAAGQLAAQYAARMPLTDHAKALRVIVDALAGGYAPDLVRAGLDRLADEHRGCTHDQLRMAILGASPNWQLAGARRKPGNPYLDDLRAEYGEAAVNAACGVPDPGPAPHLRVVAGALEAGVQ